MFIVIAFKTPSLSLSVVIIRVSFIEVALTVFVAWGSWLLIWSLPEE